MMELLTNEMPEVKNGDRVAILLSDVAKRNHWTLWEVFDKEALEETNKAEQHCIRSVPAPYGEVSEGYDLFCNNVWFFRDEVWEKDFVAVKLPRGKFVTDFYPDKEEEDW